MVYDFKLSNGGIGDCIKFFMFVLESCVQNNTRLYYKKNNLEIEKYMKLKHDIMYITEDKVTELESVEIVSPQKYYNTVDYNYSIDVKDVFYFTDEVKRNSQRLFPLDIAKYISIHLRLGDKYLETDTQYVQVKGDVRAYSDEKIYKCIEENENKAIFFCCDNNAYKLKLKEKYKNLIITNCDIGHTSLSNTTEQQVLDAITEFYLLTQSELIVGASKSGFSVIAAKFKNTPIITLYE